MRDGIPFTLPDGQTPVDYLDLENVGTVEVMRGSASSLYGNAGGGVIDIRTADPDSAKLSASTRAWTGEGASRKLVAETDGNFGAFSYTTIASRWKTDGVRDHSRQETTTADLHARLAAGANRFAISFGGFDMPVAENPGALTAAQLSADPGMADPLSVRKAAGKIVKQAQFGATATRPLKQGELRGSLYFGRRTLYNPLTFAIVGVRRHTSGAEIRGTVPLAIRGLEHRITSGIEVQRQNDERHNWANCTDLTTPLTAPTASCPVLSGQGAVSLDQTELVTSRGVYVGDEITISPRYIVTGSARADAVSFAVKDRFITQTNPNDSGRRSLRSVSPMLGLTIRLSPTSSYYWNLSSAFETPTATELGNHPDGSAGINQDLQPQKSLTYEAGYKGVTHSGVRLNAALFATEVRDELVPFEIPASNGRRYFRNAGRTSRKGAELGVERAVGSASFGLAYTYGSFRYRKYTVGGTSYAGKLVPGVAASDLQASAAMAFGSVTLVGEGRFSGKAFANDANTVHAPGYSVFNLRFISQGVGMIRGLSVIAGAYNIFNRGYASNLAVNATGGKFFEPGQLRSLYAGFTLKFSPPTPRPK